MSDKIRKPLKSSEVAARFGILPHAVRQLWRRGILKAEFFGRDLAFDPDSVDEEEKRREIKAARRTTSSSEVN